MSDLTPCNFCTLQALRKRARAKGKRLTLFPGTTAGGVDVLIHPGVTRAELKRNRDLYFAAWFMELTDHCVC